MNCNYCDGVTRRDFLKIGVAGGMGLSLAGYLRLAAAGEVRSARAQAAIFVNLSGGPSHLDTFDLKPLAPADYRGEFKPISTNVKGIEICEHLPRLAKCADKYQIVRGVSHTIADHQFGTQYMTTGNRPTPSFEYPGFGAVVSRELPGPADMPPFVAIPNTPERAGFLGARYSPMQTGASPALGKPFAVRGLALGSDMSITVVERRQQLLHDVDKALAEVEKDNDVLMGLDRFKQEAYSIIMSTRARQAFDTSREPRAMAETFGSHAFGQSCLLAGRLIEAGVRFVTVSLGSWDTHIQNFRALKGGAGAVPGLLPRFDEGLAALLAWLETRGLLASTAVFVTGEFGRTPKINKTAGRDHWARSMFVLLAGGGFKRGQVVGASDATGEAPTGTPYRPEDLAASFYHALGIDHTKEYHTASGRPIAIVRDGRILPELFA
jgi:hypothetical protein